MVCIDTTNATQICNLNGSIMAILDLHTLVHLFKLVDNVVVVLCRFPNGMSIDIWLIKNPVPRKETISKCQRVRVEAYVCLFIWYFKIACVVFLILKFYRSHATCGLSSPQAKDYCFAHIIESSYREL